MIPNGWKTVTLGEFVTLQRGYDLSTDQRTSGAIPVMGSAGISGYHNQAKTSGPGVTIGRSGVGSMGVVSYCPVDYWPLNTTLFVTDFHGNHPRFTYYFLKSLNFRRFDSGSAQASLNRNYIYNLTITVPEKDEQQAIAYILGSLDDKIELNRQMNQALEVMARALFKAWFVDFEPVRARQEGRPPTSADPETAALFPDRLVETELGLVPEGWQITSLDEIANYLNGLALQKYPPEDNKFLPVIKIRELRQGNSDESSDKTSPNIPAAYVITDGDIIFSWSGSLLVDIWCGGQGALNQHLFKVTSQKYPKWFFYLWTQYHLAEFQLIAAGKATTMGHIKRAHISTALTLIPPDNLLQVMNQIMEPLLDAIVNNRVQSRTLIHLRDTLLPQLISGQLRVPELETILEATL